MKQFTDFQILQTLDDSDVLVGVDISANANIQVPFLAIRKGVTGTSDGVMPITRGGTGATSATDARTNLGAAAANHTHTAAAVGADAAGTAASAVAAHVAASDPHTQYQEASDVAAAVAAHANLTNNPHSTTAAQVGADAAGTAASAIAAHNAASDPHPQYMTEAETNTRIDQRHASLTNNPHNTTAAQVGADPAGTAATAILAHTAALDPHTQYQTSAETQAQVDAHANLTNNPHHVTAVQVGADAAGTATTIMTAHTNDSNPHPQYQSSSQVASAVAAHASLTNNPHQTTAQQVGAEPAGYADTAIANHAAASDPHNVYVLKTQKDAANGVAGLDSDGKVPAAHLGAHSHTIANVTGLQTALDGKEVAGTMQTHVAASDPHPQYLTTVEGTTLVNTHADRRDNPHFTTAAQVNAEPAGSVAAHVALANPHTQYMFAAARAAANGVAALDETGKLPLSELPSHTHTAYQTVADKDQPNGYASLDGAGKLPLSELPAHSQAISTITGLQTALDSKSATGHGHAIADVTGLQTALDSKIGNLSGLPARGTPDGTGLIPVEVSATLKKLSEADLVGKTPITAAGSSVAIDLEHELATACNVLRYGAVGDGVHDDTSAIQAAIDAAMPKGKSVYFPAGRYKITSTLRLFFNYNTTSYPENDVVVCGFFGDGLKSTRIEWHGTTPMTSGRFAMLIAKGFFSMSGITFTCPRRFKNLDASLANIRTPYYGIVFYGTAWRMCHQDIAVENVHVPLSAGIVKNINTSTWELEPASGGVPCVVDFAQNTFKNCRFCAYTDEYSDGTFTAGSTNNANGSNLLTGNALSTPLSSASYSDASFAVEIGLQQSVGNSFWSCQVKQENASLAVVRTDQTGQTTWDRTMFIGERISGITGLLPAFFENCPTYTASINVIRSGYFISSIIKANAFNGLTCIYDMSGEDSDTSRPGGTVVEMVSGINGSINSGHKIVISGGDMYRFVATNTRYRFNINEDTPGASSVKGYVTSQDKSCKIQGILGPVATTIRSAGLEVSNNSIPKQTINSCPDLPSILADSTKQPEDLPTTLYRAGVARTNMGSRIFRAGKWMFSLLLDNPNFIEICCPISLLCAHDIKFSVYAKFKSGKAIADMNDDLKVVLYLRQANFSSIANQGVYAQQLLGAITPTLNYNLLQPPVNDISLTHITVARFVPSSDAAYASFRIESPSGKPRSTVFDELAVGGFSIMPSIGNDSTENVSSAPSKSVIADVTGLQTALDNKKSLADIAKTLTYNQDGTLNVVSDANGTKTFNYTNGKLTSITGTGKYVSKTFNYTGNALTSISVP